MLKQASQQELEPNLPEGNTPPAKSCLTMPRALSLPLEPPTYPSPVNWWLLGHHNHRGSGPENYVFGKHKHRPNDPILTENVQQYNSEHYLTIKPPLSTGAFTREFANELLVDQHHQNGNETTIRCRIPCRILFSGKLDLNRKEIECPKVHPMDKI